MNDLQLLEYRNKLLIAYGALLTDVQRKIMEDYYVYNLSISEISENQDISRAAVSDCLKKSELKLEEYEKRLHLLSKRELVLDKVDEWKSKTKEEIIDEIERMVENGI